NLLTVGATSGATAFFQAAPTGSCDSSCAKGVAYPSSGGSLAADGTTTSNIKVSFTFVDPNGQNDVVQATAAYTADYANQTVSVDWVGATNTSNGGYSCYTGTENGEPADPTCLTLFATFTD